MSANTNPAPLTDTYRTAFAYLYGAGVSASIAAAFARWVITTGATPTAVGAFWYDATARDIRVALDARPVTGRGAVRIAIPA